MDKAIADGIAHGQSSARKAEDYLRVAWRIVTDQGLREYTTYYEGRMLSDQAEVIALILREASPLLSENIAVKTALQKLIARVPQK